MSAGWMIAWLYLLGFKRKVRAPGKQDAGETPAREAFMLAWRLNLRESAAESIPPGNAQVRVKGCGKSAPRIL